MRDQPDSEPPCSSDHGGQTDRGSQDESGIVEIYGVTGSATCVTEAFVVRQWFLVEYPAGQSLTVLVSTSSCTIRGPTLVRRVIVVAAGSLYSSTESARAVWRRHLLRIRALRRCKNVCNETINSPLSKDDDDATREPTDATFCLRRQHTAPTSANSISVIRVTYLFSVRERERERERTKLTLFVHSVVFYLAF